MLILSRKPGQSIMIGDEICLTVTAIHGNDVRIGINAPHNMPVHREEIYHKIQKEKREKNLDQYHDNEQD